LPNKHNNVLRKGKGRSVYILLKYSTEGTVIGQLQPVAALLTDVGYGVYF